MKDRTWMFSNTASELAHASAHRFLDTLYLCFIGEIRFLYVTKQIYSTTDQILAVRTYHSRWEIVAIHIPGRESVKPHSYSNKIVKSVLWIWVVTTASNMQRCHQGRRHDIPAAKTRWQAIFSSEIRKDTSISRNKPFRRLKSSFVLSARIFAAIYFKSDSRVHEIWLCTEAILGRSWKSKPQTLNHIPRSIRFVC